MGLRESKTKPGFGPPKLMKMGASGGNLFQRGMEEIVDALEKSRPQGSLIRIARFEPINVRRPSDEDGR
jgi:hypothetical protein